MILQIEQSGTSAEINHITYLTRSATPFRSCCISKSTLKVSSKTRTPYIFLLYNTLTTRSAQYHLNTIGRVESNQHWGSGLDHGDIPTGRDWPRRSPRRSRNQHGLVACSRSCRRRGDLVSREREYVLRCHDLTMYDEVL